MKKWLLYILAGMFTLALLAFGAFYIWAEQTYEASDQLSDIPERQGDWLIFEPDGEPKAGVVLYPGAKVEPEAYSYIGNHLQEQGYLTAVPSMRFNFPILEAQKADAILERYPLDEWFIGGHSLGGVAASAYAGENQKQLSGLFFLASYPSDQDDFSGTDFPVLSIYGEKDGLTTLSDIEKRNIFFQMLLSSMKSRVATTPNSAGTGNRRGTIQRIFQFKNSRTLLSKSSRHGLKHPRAGS